VSWKGASLFYHQLAVVVRTDLPVAKALVLSGPVASGFHRLHAAAWGAGCEAGSPLWQLLQASGEDPMAVALVRAGEISGRLPELADRLATHYEHLDKLAWDFAARALYPFGLLHLALLVAALPMVIFFGWPLYSLLYGPVGLWLAIVALAVAGRFAHASGLLGRLMLKPGPDLLVRPLLTSMTCEVLGAAFAAGMLVPEAFELAAGAVGNRTWAERMRALARRARDGAVPGVGAAMAELGFAQTHVAIISSAEVAGRLDQSLDQVATIAEDAFRQRTVWLVRILNAVIYAVAALVVGAVVIGAAMSYVNFLSGLARET
jgi:type II secretory pathway component PulF